MERIGREKRLSLARVTSPYDTHEMGSPTLEKLFGCSHETCNRDGLRYNVKSKQLEYPRGDLILRTEEYEPFEGSNGLLYILSMQNPVVLIFSGEADVRSVLDWLEWVKKPVTF
jgi:hypothetical protein